MYREIKRNFFSDGELPYLGGYYGMTAQRSAAARRARRCKLVRQIELRKAVIAQLKEGWSPEQIAGRLGFEGRPVRVSHETIYAYIYGPDGQSKELARHLPSRRKKRQPRYARRPRSQVFPSERSIHQRPEHVKARDAFGDWGGDLMIFERATGKMNVASLVERKTRFAVLFRNNDRSSTHFMSKLMGVMEALPQPARTSITFDRGFEFLEWRKLKPGIGMEAWFCDPQAPLAKGIGRKPKQTCAPISAAGHATRGALKSLYEGDLRPPERDTQKVPWMADPNRSLQGRIDKTEIAETVATTLEPPTQWRCSR